MSLNWTNLVAKGRAKDMGIPWNEEELHARYTLNIPAEYVREGVLTVEALEDARKAKDKPKSRKELEAEAKENGVEYSEETPDTILKTHVEKKVEDKPKSKNK